MPSEKFTLDDLTQYLAGVCPTAELSIKSVGGTCESLVIFKNERVLAAFAISGDDTLASYDSLYSNFKSYFKNEAGKGEESEPAFVFGVNHNVDDIEHLSSRIETDVYFCRKYVVLFRETLSETFARLPFLPITPPNGTAFRPPSVQTLMESAGVSAELAKNLAVQSTKSPERLVNDCVAGRFGEPVLDISGEMADIRNASVPSSSVRLTSVLIENFRAYREPRSFEIGADITVLYGPNGFGKTSFFDAIDFAVTGGIGRLQGVNDSQFSSVARHLDSKNDISAVTITLQDEERKSKIRRNVDDAKFAILDDARVDRKKLLSRLTGGVLAGDDRVEHMVRLFRATHLFSQEHQELTQEVQSKSELSAPLVSRMLAFDDYANARAKAGKVSDVLLGGIRTFNRQIEDIEQKIDAEGFELDALASDSSEVSSEALLPELIKTIQADLLDAGVNASEENVDVTTVRRWRGYLEQLFSNVSTRRVAFEGLLEKIQVFPQMQGSVEDLQVQMAQNISSQQEFEKRRLQLEADLAIAEAAHREIVSSAKAMATKVDGCRWALGNRATYLMALENLSQAREKFSILQKDLETIRQSHAEKSSSLDGAKARQAAVHAALTETGLKINDLRQLAALSDRYAGLAKTCDELRDAIRAQRQIVNNLNLSQAKVSSEIESCRINEMHLSKTIKSAEEHYSDMVNLLNQVRAHVHDSDCPLCGYKYESESELLRRIDAYRPVDSTTVAREELFILQGRARELVLQVEELKASNTVAAGRLAELLEKEATVVAEMSGLAQAGVVLNVPQNNVASVDNFIISQISVLEDKLSTLKVELKTAEDILSGQQEIFAPVKEQFERSQRDVEVVKRTVSRLSNEIEGVRSRALELGVSLDGEESDLLALEREYEDKLAMLEQSAEKASSAVGKLKKDLDLEQSSLKSLRSSAQSLRVRTSSLQSELTQIKSILESFGLPLDVKEQALQLLVIAEARDEVKYAQLIERLNSIDMAIDSATTAAALKSMSFNLQQKQASLSVMISQRESYETWLKYFSSLVEFISSYQNRAISEFTLQYGPLTSVIQQRLRSVYGFEDISMRGVDSRIVVTVKRDGKDLRPIDFFSQSQQQTLLLGLFLTACSSQTWSSFSPVLLDDPVTHFDDLNTYAFLDLVLGLLGEHGLHRQFVISTCDEKLLQLARQKFRCLGDRAKFYRFSAIGESGPDVVQLH